MHIDKIKYYSVLSNFKNGKYRSKPFPYIVIDNALPTDYYDELDRTFPIYEKFINEQEILQNTAYRIPAAKALSQMELPEIWKYFILYHVNFAFVKEVYNIFEKDIYDLYPKFENNLPKKEHSGIRFLNEKHLNLDCQFVINTPVKKKSSVRKPHVDNPVEFFAGLLYMRNQDDNSKGGNLCTYEFINKPIFYGKSTVENQYVRIVEEIEYKPNRLVLFINSLHSLHGVTDKYISPHFRKYMNIIGEFKFELFDFKPYLK